MAVSKDTEEKIQQLQIFEQNLQNLMLQKQAMQMQLVESESALGELEKTGTAYRIIGSIMVSSDKDELKSLLGGKKETTELRIKTIEKQEKLIRERATKLQKEVLGEIKEE
ncbi:prefoldin subunit beta [Candidatus Woesearchaeota archaeon]|nr:prefoldin subunit beta [Candidatus Woesearchaeota archaeon]